MRRQSDDHQRNTVLTRNHQREDSETMEPAADGDFRVTKTNNQRVVTHHQRVYQEQEDPNDY